MNFYYTRFLPYMLTSEPVTKKKCLVLVLNLSALLLLR